MDYYQRGYLLRRDASKSWNQGCINERGPREEERSREAARNVMET